MKIYLKIIVLVIGFLCLPSFVKATCSNERSAELSKIAANVQISYTYEFVQANPNFTVIITNLSDDIYIYDNYGKLFIGNGERITNYTSGTSVTFEIFSNDNSCKGEKLLTQYINLPSYNIYSTYPDCEGIEEHKYCSMWTNTFGIDYANIKKDLENYKKKKESIKTEKPVEKKDYFKAIIIFITEYILYFACIIGVFILAIVYAIYKKKKKKKIYFGSGVRK